MWFYGMLIFLSLYIVYFINLTIKRRNLPPGPIYLPFLGNAIQFVYGHLEHLEFPVEPWKVMSRWTEKYGPFYYFGFYKYHTLILNTYEDHAELLEQEEVSGKITNASIQRKTFQKELGLVFVEEPGMWHEMRKFSIRTLRDFGFGKTMSMQGVISSELSEIESQWKAKLKETNGVMLMKNNFFLSILNVTWSMVTGQSYAHNDPKLMHIGDLTLTFAKQVTLANPLFLFDFLLDLIPEWLLKVPVREGLKFLDDIHLMSKEIIDDRKKVGAYLQEPENYVDVFLRRIEESKGKPHSYYTEQQLQVMIEDFWFVSTMTTSATMGYAMLFMVLYPEVQKRIQEEVDALVPRHLIPTLEDIEKMPYTQATILEIHRMAKVVPIPIPRVTVAETTFKGYRIPKGTYILSNHWHFLSDKKLWGDPENFRPERFLNEKGEYVYDKRVAVFGFGKRYCVGVGLVKNVVPIYVATMLQRFNFSVMPGEAPPRADPEVGINLSPFAYNAYVTPRD